MGDPGNACEANTGGCFGAVAYEYRIGEYEVTNAQYTEFLNAVDSTGANALALYNAAMGINFVGGNPDGSKYVVVSGFESKPVVYVSFCDTLRYANWLHNGQGTGSTGIRKENRNEG